MTRECDQVSLWLDAVDSGPPGPALEAHAAACESCRRRMALEQVLREGLSGGAALDSARRAALVDRIAPEAAPRLAATQRGARVDDATILPPQEHAHANSRVSMPPTKAGRRARRWPWLGTLAAAATVILAVSLFFYPASSRPAVLPSQVFGDLLGPLAEASPLLPPATTPADDSPLTAVLTAFWGDFEGPITIGRDAMQAPRAVAAVRSDAGATPQVR